MKNVICFPLIRFKVLLLQLSTLLCIIILTTLFDTIVWGGIKMSDINILLDQAVNETEKLIDGEVFLLRDLFKGYEWNRISRSNRLLLGTLFLNKISCDNLEITASAKTSSGQQKYQIIRRNHHA